MTTNENSASENQAIDLPLYAESKLTRKQAIGEIADVILRSNMKPRTVGYALQLLQKLLPMNHTLPTTVDELFGAMMSSENDWRLAQYFIRHQQTPSFLSLSTTLVDGSLFSIEEQESNSPTQLVSPIFRPFNSNESSSSSDDENELSPYDRLQQSLQPITDICTNMNFNYVTSLQTENSNSLLSYDQRSQSASNAANPSTILQSLKRLLSETSSTHEEDLFYPSRMFADSEDEASCHSTTNDSNKSCCFEINGRNLLNGNKRRRYN